MTAKTDRSLGHRRRCSGEVRRTEKGDDGERRVCAQHQAAVSLPPLGGGGGLNLGKALTRWKGQGVPPVGQVGFGWTAGGCGGGWHTAVTVGQAPVRSVCRGVAAGWGSPMDGRTGRWRAVSAGPVRQRGDQEEDWWMPGSRESYCARSRRYPPRVEIGGRRASREALRLRSWWRSEGVSVSRAGVKSGQGRHADRSPPVLGIEMKSVSTRRGAAHGPRAE